MAAKHQLLDSVTYLTSHMWFGDLVSTKWWSSVWIQKGLTSLYARLAENEILPGIDGESRLLFDRCRLVMQEEAHSMTKPLNLTVNNVNEIDEVLRYPAISKGMVQ